MKYLLVSLASALLLVPAFSRATSVSPASSGGGRDVVDADGAPLANGSLVLIGTFTNPEAISVAPVFDLQSAAGWSQFGNALGIGSIFGTPGKLLGTDTDTSVAADAFNGKTVYLWIFNASTLADSTQYGIYSASAGTPAWLFPANGGGLGDLLTISANDLSLQAIGNAGSVDASHLQLVAFASVPEPSAYALLGLGLLTLCLQRQIFRRRQRSRAFFR